MAKKNCRMTYNERAVHDRAVSLRKMTDQQLCDAMDRKYNDGLDEGVEIGIREGIRRRSAKQKSDREVVELFISFLEDRVGSGNGIGGGTVYRLHKELDAAVTDGILGGAK